MADSTSPLVQVETSQAQKEVTVNNLFDAHSPASFGGRRAEACSLLTWGYYGGRWGGSAVANGTLALDASTDNYIVADRTTGAVALTTSDDEWNDPVGYVRLYKVTTGLVAVTSYEDHRAGPNGLLGITAGDAYGPANSVDNTLARWDGTDTKTLQDSGINVSDADEIDGYRGNIKRVTASTYTLLAADTGKVLELADGTGVDLSLPDDLPKGWCATIVQAGVGAVAFNPDSGASLENRQTHTETAGQWAVCVLYVSENTGGNAAEYVLGGDTAA